MKRNSILLRTLTILAFFNILTGCLAVKGTQPQSAQFESLEPKQQILEIQSDLKTLGYYSSSLDGIYGKKTASAIRGFQRDHDMTQDGQVSQSVYVQAGLAVEEKRKPKSSALQSDAAQATQKNSSPRASFFKISLSPKSKGSTQKLSEPNDQVNIVSTNSNDSGFTSILRSSVTPPPGSPPNDVIEQAVREELQGSIPGRWVKYGKNGKNAKFGRMEIVKWGAYNEKIGYFPVKIRVAGDAVVYDVMFKPIPKHFDEIAEFRFSKDDYGDWVSLFFRPGAFGGGSWVD